MVTLPDTIPEHAADLIVKILKPVPTERLGAGLPGSE